MRCEPATGRPNTPPKAAAASQAAANLTTALTLPIISRMPLAQPFAASLSARRRLLAALCGSLVLHLLCLLPTGRGPASTPRPRRLTARIASPSEPPVATTAASAPATPRARPQQPRLPTGGGRADSVERANADADMDGQPPPESLLAAYRLALYRTLREPCCQLPPTLVAWRGDAYFTLTVAPAQAPTLAAGTGLPPQLVAALLPPSRAAVAHTPLPPALHSQSLSLELAYRCSG